MNYYELNLFNEFMNLDKVRKYINMVKDFSYELYNHSIRVCIITYKIAEYYNLNEKDKDTLITAGLLHDIGKLKVPHEILMNPSNLSSEEFEIVDRHAQYSYKILFGLENEDVRKVAAMHHCFSKKNKHILNQSNYLYFLTELLSVADVYEALSSERVYKEKIDFNEICEIMLSDNFTWDKKIVKEILFNIIKPQSL